jgi:HD-GYP domain-containing protein (c-di-GMP phosphodiesterase class II)
MHLYFAGTNHVMLWRESGDLIASDFLGRYRERGLKAIWILRGDERAFKKYLEGPARAKPVEAKKPDELEELEAIKAPDIADEAQPKKPKTVEATKILAALKDPALPKEKKAEKAAEVAQGVLEKAAAPQNLDEEKKVKAHAREIIKEVLSGALDDVASTAQEIWRLSDVDPSFEHAVNVSTYAALFALAFGRIDPELLADVALAGLLHDIGLSQIPAHYAAKIWKDHQETDREEYARHVMAGLELIDLFAPETSPRVRTILQQHHEKFDGNGYPKKLQGFQVDDIAQLVAMADLLESIASGRYDGEERTFSAALLALEKVERARTFPEHFNPEVFSTVMRWTKSDKLGEQIGAAATVVKEQSQKLLDKGKSAA